MRSHFEGQNRRAKERKGKWLVLGSLQSPINSPADRSEPVAVKWIYDPCVYFVSLAVRFCFCSCCRVFFLFFFCLSLLLYDDPSSSSVDRLVGTSFVQSKVTDRREVCDAGSGQTYRLHNMTNRRRPAGSDNGPTDGWRRRKRSQLSGLSAHVLAIKRANGYPWTGAETR